MFDRGTRKHVTWLLALVSLMALFAVACSGDDDDDGGDGAGFTDDGYKAAGLDKEKVVTVDGDIVIGVSAALTGDAAGLGIPIADSAESAGDGVQIKGHNIKFVREDDLCTAEGGPAAAERLIQAKVVA